MFDEYWLDRQLTDNDLLIPRMKFLDRSHGTLELPLNVAASFLSVSFSKGVPAIGLSLRKTVMLDEANFDRGLGSFFWRP